MRGRLIVHGWWPGLPRNILLGIMRGGKRVLGIGIRLMRRMRNIRHRRHWGFPDRWASTHRVRRSERTKAIRSVLACRLKMRWCRASRPI